MIEELHRQGVKILLWQVPVMKKLESPNDQHARDEAYMVEKGYCVQEEDGTPYKIRPFWFRDGLLLDVTNEEGVAWWMNKRAYLLDELGIDGFKTDGGEHIWGRDLRFADGRRGRDLWNLYPNLYVAAYYDFANERSDEQAITFSRAGFTGAQGTPCHWAGDEDSTWAAFRKSILAGLSAGMSGISFWGWDMGGFSGHIPTAELYLRSAAMATFCPIMQYHSENNARQKPSRDRTPWNIQERTGDSDVIPVFRYFANLRMNLLPYIFSEAWGSSETGIPLMRSLLLEYPEDALCKEYPYQYLFGSSLLVAPVVEPGREMWDVYLPEGQWHDFWTGEEYSGYQTIACSVPKDRIPVYVRQGAILPLNLDSSVTLGSDVGNDVASYRTLCFRIYPRGDVIYNWYDVTSQEVHQLRCTLDEGKGKLMVIVPLMSHRLLLTLYVREVVQVLLNDEPLPEMSPQSEHLSSPGNSWYEDTKHGEVSITLAAWALGHNQTKKPGSLTIKYKAD
jgi:alpha-glucosidase (family GH31 glycosyl hydrolase)